MSGPLHNPSPDHFTMVDAHSGEILDQDTPGTVVEDLLATPETLTGVYPRIVINNAISGSDVNPLQFEATTAPGDNGGPILVQVGSEWVIAGVLSGGTTNTSVYGDISWWTGTSIFQSQIEALGGVFVGSNPGTGTVDLDDTSYSVGDTLTVTVTEQNAVAPLAVTVVSGSMVASGNTTTIPAG